MSKNPVDLIKDEYDALALFLKDKQEISLLSDLNKNFRKILLLAASSYFEHTVTAILLEFVREKSNNDERIVNFLEKQAITAKYHTLFDWGKRGQLENFEKKGANQFWKLFGDTFKAQIDSELKASNEETEAAKLERENKINAIEAFIEIGHHRNILVHNNFAAYDYDQNTPDEIFELFKKAEPFILFLKAKLL